MLPNNVRGIRKFHVLQTYPAAELYNNRDQKPAVMELPTVRNPPSHGGNRKARQQ
jgi:hypothetical protein